MRLNAMDNPTLLLFLAFRLARVGLHGGGGRWHRLMGYSRITNHHSGVLPCGISTIKFSSVFNIFVSLLNYRAIYCTTIHN